MKVLGILFTDGGLSRINKWQWIIHVSNNSRALLEEILFSIQNLWKIRWFKIQDFGSWHHLLVLCTNKMVEELHSISPSFRKLPCKAFPPHNHSLVNCNPVVINGVEFPPTRLPKFLFEVNKSLKSVFLRFAFGGDGFASLTFRNTPRFRADKQIALVCHHPLLKEDFFRLISEFVECSKLSDRIRIHISPENVRSFIENIGFPECVFSTSKLWNGLRRIDIAKLILIAEKFENSKRNFWSRFTSVTEAKEFLLNTLRNS